MSAPNPRSWRKHEQDCARYLSQRLDLAITSSRNVQGGRQYGADLVTRSDDGTVIPTIYGWSIECKQSKNGHDISGWMRQAKRQSDSRLYAVIAKVPGRGVERSQVYVTADALSWWLTARSSDDETVEAMWLSTWAGLLSIDLADSRGCV